MIIFCVICISIIRFFPLAYLLLYYPNSFLFFFFITNNMSSFSASSLLESFEDVTPVLQDDGPNPLVQIMYDPMYVQLMDIFRAILRSNERSQRVLQLTAELLTMNAANYTIWKYRRDCLKALCTDWALEFDYMDKFAEENPKNYQIWYHRRAIVEESRISSKEIPFCNRVFEEDAKNYHAWAHRQWVLTNFNLYEGELEYTSGLIENDVCNNSAWNHRWFIVHNENDAAATGVSLDTLNREITYTMEKIKIIPENEASWNYLRGLCRKHKTLQTTVEKLCHEFKDNLVTKHAPEPYVCTFLWSLLVDFMEERKSSDSLQTALALIDDLKHHDKVRVKYWARRFLSITEQLLM